MIKSQSAFYQEVLPSSNQLGQWRFQSERTAHGFSGQKKSLPAICASVKKFAFYLLPVYLGHWILDMQDK